MFRNLCVWHAVVLCLVMVVHMIAGPSEVSAWNAIKFCALPMLEFEVKGAAKQDILIISIMKNNAPFQTKTEANSVTKHDFVPFYLLIYSWCCSQYYLQISMTVLTAISGLFGATRKPWGVKMAYTLTVVLSSRCCGSHKEVKPLSWQFQNLSASLDGKTSSTRTAFISCVRDKRRTGTGKSLDMKQTHSSIAGQANR